MDRAQQFRIAVRKYPPFEDAIRAQWEKFEAQARTGLEVQIEALDLGPLEDALFTSDGMRNGDWDVAFVATDWIAAAAERECAVDLAGLLRDDAPLDYPQGWTESLLRLQRVGDKVLGVPYHDGPECLMYRRDLFEDAELRKRYQASFGEVLAPPSTWEQFHRIARFLNAPEQGRYGTVFAAYPDGHNTVYDFLLQVWTRGGDLFKADGSLQFDTAEANEALSFYREVVKDPLAAHPRCGELDSVGAGLEFAAGRVAMMINWFGFAAMAHSSPESQVRGLVDVAEIPHAPGASSASLNVYWVLSIAQGSPHKREAWKFLRHVLSPDMDKITTLSGAIGCRRSTWVDQDVNRMIPFYSRMEDLHRNAREIPARADWPQIASVIDELVTSAVATESSTEELLRRADARIGS